MSYQSISIPNLQANEVGVQLDTGQYVAIALVPTVVDSGQLSIAGFARVVDASGQPVVFNGQPLTSSYTHTCSAADIALYGSSDNVAKQVAMAVLGEPCQIFSDPTNSGVHAQVAADASIRTNIASHQFAQSMTIQGLL